MKERKEIIERIRRHISYRYLVYSYVAGLISLTGLSLLFFSGTFSPIKPISTCMVGLGIGFLWYCSYHRYQMLSRFEGRYEDAPLRLESYLAAKQTKWERHGLLRIGGMCLLGMIMLMLLFKHGDTEWTRLISATFISLILALIIKGWMDFNDQILRHEIHRSFRDQMSE